MEETPESKFQKTLKVTGETLVDTVRKLLHEGNVRRIIIKDENGKVLFGFPMTVGVLGALVSAPLTILGTMVILFKEYTITVEKSETEKDIKEVIDES